jgi:hypothetical protein
MMETREMQAEEILARARTGAELPESWIVFPLLRNKVMLGIVGWVFGIFVGLGLLALVGFVVIPGNYQSGFGAALFTTILLGIFLFIGLGSLWALITDVRRLMHADRHIMVLTPDDFVKQEEDKIAHVPCVNIRHVTARGTPPPDRTPPSGNVVEQVSGVGENMTGLFLGRRIASSIGSRSGGNSRRKGRRTSTSLAFVDTRTEREVIVTNDNSFGDTFYIAALLKQYAASAQQIFTRQ